MSKPGDIFVDKLTFFCLQDFKKCINKVIKICPLEMKVCTKFDDNQSTILVAKVIQTKNCQPRGTGDRYHMCLQNNGNSSDDC